MSAQRVDFYEAMERQLREVIGIEPATPARELRFLMADQGEGYAVALTASELVDEVKQARLPIAAEGHAVPTCCAEDALRAHIANGDGRYVGGYHGDDNTSDQAVVALQVARTRHPDHALTQPDSTAVLAERAHGLTAPSAPAPSTSTPA